MGVSREEEGLFGAESVPVLDEFDEGGRENV